MQHVGLHIRTEGSLLNLIDRARMLQLPFFQCFFVAHATQRLVRPNKREIEQFSQQIRDHFSALYVHGSYWINLAHVPHTGYAAFHRELKLAQQLSGTHLVLHPGTAKGVKDKYEGIDILARTLNEIHQVDHGITLVLENTAHGNLAIGSDITDFRLLLEKLDKPDRIAFCIDTAHAHAYGYDLISPEGQRDFLALVEASVGMSRIRLIHLNDTRESRGSLIDRHVLMGQGVLGSSVLRSFVCRPELSGIPIIMELPPVSVPIEQEMLSVVRGWFS